MSAQNLSLNDQLILAVKEPDLEKVQAILAKNPNLDAVDKYGATALHWAMRNSSSDPETQKNCESIIKLLLDKFPDRKSAVNALLKKSIRHISPLREAYENQNAQDYLKIIFEGDRFSDSEKSKLLSAKIIEANDENMLQVSLRKGGVAMVQKLLSYYPDPKTRMAAILEQSNGQDGIFWAALPDVQGQERSIEMLSVLLSYFPDPKTTMIQALEKDNYYMLFSIINNRDNRTLEFVLSHYPNDKARFEVLSKLNNGLGPLYNESLLKSKDATNKIVYLLSLGCDPVENLQKFITQKFLGKKEVDSITTKIFTILALLFNPEPNTENGLSPNMMEACKSLGMLGPAVNARSRAQQGNTPLHIAIKTKNKELAYHLICHNDVISNIPNNDGNTAFDLAMESKDPFFMGLLNFARASELKKELNQKEKKEKEEKIEGEARELLQKQFIEATLASRSLIDTLTDLPVSPRRLLGLKLLELYAPIDKFGNLSAPVDPIAVYEFLSKIEKILSERVRFINKLMYQLLTGHLAVQSDSPLVLVTRSHIFEPTLEMKSSHEKVILSLDEDEPETESQKSPQAEKIDDKLTLKYKMKHLFLSGLLLQDPSYKQEMYHFIAEYVYDLNFAPAFGEAIYKEIEANKGTENVLTFLKMLELYQTIAKVAPDQLPQPEPKESKATKEALLTQYNAAQAQAPSVPLSSAPDKKKPDPTK